MQVRQTCFNFKLWLRLSTTVITHVVPAETAMDSLFTTVSSSGSGLLVWCHLIKHPLNYFVCKLLGPSYIHLHWHSLLDPTAA